LGELFVTEGCDDDMLLRFAKARNYEVQRTYEMLLKYFEWRSNYMPWKIEASDVMGETMKKKAYYFGFDKENRPSLYLFPAHHNPKETSVPDTLRFVCYIIEQIIVKMKGPVQQFTVICDMKDFGLAQLDTALAKEAAHMLQSYYPERLHATYLVNCPWTINIMWNMVKPMLEERTRRKVVFVQKLKELLNDFEPDQLLKAYGGLSELEIPDESVGF